MVKVELENGRPEENMSCMELQPIVWRSKGIRGSQWRGGQRTGLAGPAEMCHVSYLDSM